MTTSAAQRARALWKLLEPIHAVTYFAAEPLTALKSRGVVATGWATSPSARHRWGGRPRGGSRAVLQLLLRAGRQGPSGRLGAVLPAAALTAPGGSVAALRRGGPASPGCRGRAGRRSRGARRGRAAGRGTPALRRQPRAAVSAEPVARLWHAATLVREHRRGPHRGADERRDRRARVARLARPSSAPPGTPTRWPGTSPTRSGRPAWTTSPARVWSTRGC